MRHRLSIILATAFFLGLVPNAVAFDAAGAFAGLSAVSPAISAQAPEASNATHAPVWTKHAKRVRAGSVLRATLDPVSARRCTVTVLGVNRRLSTRQSIVGGGRLAVLSLRTSRSARGGSWALVADCTQADGSALSANVSFKVRNTRHGARGRLVTSKRFHVTRRAVLEDRHGAGVEGKGAGKNPFDMKQCTSWAYEKRQDVYDAAVRAGVRPTGLVAHPAFSEDYIWNGRRWAENARAAGIPTGTTPAVGALFVNTTGRYGHVALVEEVYGDGTYKISQRNASGRGDSETVTTSVQYPGRPGIEFVYGGPAAGAEYIGHIVQWDGDTKGQKTAWYVVSNGGHPQRNWIPDSATFYCLKRRGAPGPDVLPSGVLSNELPDQNGISARCSDGQGAKDPVPNTPSPPPVTPTSAPSNPPPPIPQPTAWPETTGGSANTWTNHTNAGGTQGPTIPGGTTVQISCKLSGFRVADGNTWWYRIAQAPWNNAYYVSADAFYNNGQTSGSLHGTPLVDPAVADC